LATPLKRPPCGGLLFNDAYSVTVTSASTLGLMRSFSIAAGLRIALASRLVTFWVTRSDNSKRFSETWCVR